MRIVTCNLAAALVLAVPASAGGDRDLVVPLNDGSLAFISADGQITGTLAGRPAAGSFAAVRPAWSPDGTRVVFAQGGIVVADLDGTQHRLTTALSGGYDAEPTWSGDGKQIAFLRNAGGNEDLAVVSVDGGAVRMLTSDGAYKYEPRWQPHGSEILYESYQPELGTSVVDASGGAPRRLAGAGYAEWAPDGTVIARGGPTGLELLRPDGSGGHAVSNRNVTEVAWSPDGQRIAFRVTTQFPQYGSRFGIPSQSDAFVVDRDGTDLTRLTGFEADSPFDRPMVTAPRWWPGGARLFFKKGSGVWTMTADGSCEQPFAPALPMVDEPAWSPSAAPSPAIECSSAQLRMRLSLTEVGLHDDLGFAVLVHNDGTRTLDNARLEVAATRGVVRIADGSDTCTRGRAVVCTLGSLPRGADQTLELVGTPGPTVGLVTYTAHVVWNGPSDVTPTADIVSAAAGVADCDIIGTWGSDYLVGTPRADHICGRPGPDRIEGGRGNDWIEAGSGADTVIGGPGRDRIDGGGGGDLVSVQDAQRDVVDCGTEQDTVVADQFDVLKHCERVTRVKLRRVGA